MSWCLLVQDVDGNVFDTEFENWYTSVPVFFAKGEVIPSDSNFTATFELSNIEYLKEQIEIINLEQLKKIAKLHSVPISYIAESGNRKFYKKEDLYNNIKQAIQNKIKNE